MKSLLYLVHRIPFPPNKGDKIRSFNWLKGLSERYKIYLGCFIDDPDDEQYQQELQKYCEEIFVLKLNPTTAKMKSLKGLLTNDALTLPYYYSAEMQAWVDKKIDEEQIDLMLVYSSSMTQYIEGERFATYKRVIDFVDMDSDKWRQYAQSKSWPLSWIYQREAKKLLKYEQQITTEFDSALFVSEMEAKAFRQLMPTHQANINFVNNGVDSEYFSPNNTYTNPYPKACTPLVFTGAMDYWANVDAVVWFAEKVMESLQRQLPELRFYIVGSNPAPEVIKLQDFPGVEVTGRVEDVRPFIAHAKLVVVPMRIARGIQNKVLEAMAMGKTVLVSPQAFEGISADTERDLVLVSEEHGWQDKLNELLVQDNLEIGTNARQLVLDKYTWKSNVNKLTEFLQ